MLRYHFLSEFLYLEARSARIIIFLALRASSIMNGFPAFGSVVSELPFKLGTPEVITPTDTSSGYQVGFSNPAYNSTKNQCTFYARFECTRYTFGIYDITVSATSGGIIRGNGVSYPKFTANYAINVPGYGAMISQTVGLLNLAVNTGNFSAGKAITLIHLKFLAAPLSYSQNGIYFVATNTGDLVNGGCVAQINSIITSGTFTPIIVS